MQLDQIRYFCEIAQQKSINRAAEALYINQSSLSKSIKLLEKEMGVPLFNRTTKGVQLTAFGEVFEQTARQILDLVEASLAQAKTFADQERYQKTGVLNIYLDPFVKEVLFPKCVLRFMRLFPNIQLKISEMEAEQVLTALPEGRLDLAVVDIFPRVLRQIEDSDRLSYQKLGESTPLLLVNKRSPLSKYKKISISEINSTRLIYSALLAVKNYALEFNFSTSSPQLILNALSDEGFAAMVPSFSAGYFLDHDQELVTIPIYDLMHITTAAVYPSTHDDDFYIQQLVEMLFPPK